MQEHQRNTSGRAGAASRRQALIYVAATVLCLLILLWVMRLWKAQLRIPFSYEGGDALLAATWVKGEIDHGWYLKNPSVGTPFGLDLRDMLPGDTLHMGAMKILSLVSGDWPVVINLYFLLTFPLTTLASLSVLRHFRISWAPSLLASLLFSFLPYHFFRGIGHLFLSSYYLVPPMTMVILWVALGCPLFEAQDCRAPIWRWRERKGMISVAICVLMALGGIYYAFFAALLLLVAGVFGSIQRCSRRPLLIALLLVAVLSSVLALNLSPTLINSLQNGPNVQLAVRVPLEAELYGMRIAQLVLPVSGHRLPLMARLKAAYNGTATAVAPNENDSVTLGAVASAGFLFLVGWLVLGRREGRGGALLHSLSVINLAAVLLATMGGFGCLFAFLALPTIRAYNRISPYIAFLSLFAVALVLDRAGRKWFRTRVTRLAFQGSLGGILILGVLDQTVPLFVPPYQQNRADYNSDRDFVQRIEAALPSNAMIFQLPYLSFPENGPLLAMSDYDLFRGYLHLRALRWSYGTVKGRYGDAQNRFLAARPAAEMVELLCLAGFSGLYLDRNGYGGPGGELENTLSTLLGSRALVSANRRLVFFNLSAFTQGLRRRYTAQEWEAAREAVARRLVVEWRGGFFSLEGSESYNWRWCASSGDLLIQNTSERPRTVVLEMTLIPARPEVSNMRVHGLGISEFFQIGQPGRRISKKLTLSPGKSAIRFWSDGKPLYLPRDPRALVFKVANFRLDAVSEPLDFEWTGGFSALERSPDRTWRWCSYKGEATIENKAQKPRDVVLEMSLATGSETLADVCMEGPLFSACAKANAAGQSFSQRVVVPPGKHIVRFSTNASRINAPGDPRTLVFRVDNFRYGDYLQSPGFVSLN